MEEHLSQQSQNVDEEKDQISSEKKQEEAKIENPQDYAAKPIQTFGSLNKEEKAQKLFAIKQYYRALMN